LELSPVVNEQTPANSGTASPRDLAHTSAEDLRTIAAAEKEALVHEVFQSVSENYDRMNDVISFRQHRKWKNDLIDAVTAGGHGDILDIATGTGDIALWIAERNPTSRIIGSDFSENMLLVAERRLADSGLTNVSFSHQNAMELSFPDASFDCVTVSFGMRNMPDYLQVINEVGRVLRPGGVFYCLESSWPTNPVIKPFFGLYFRYLMPLFGKLSGAGDEYRYLNESTEAFLTKDELADLMEQAGLTEVVYRSMMFGSAALHTGIKPEA